jgi:hypothetical protein
LEGLMNLTPLHFNVSLLVRPVAGSVAGSVFESVAEHALAPVAVASHGPVAAYFVQRGC